MVYRYSVTLNGNTVGDVTGNSYEAARLKAIQWYGHGCILQFIRMWDGTRFLYSNELSQSWDGEKYIYTSI